MYRSLLFIWLAATSMMSVAAVNKTPELHSYQSSSNPYYWKNRIPVAGYWQQDVHYKIDGVVNDQEESITAIEHLQYWNNSPDEIKRVYFHLYQNAFTPESYLSSMRAEDNVKSVYGKHESMGEGTVIRSISINGSKVKFTIDNTILYIDLLEPLKSGEGLDLDIDFTTFWDKDDAGNIRRRMKTFRHGGKDDREFLHFDGVHWYPRIAVYDRKFGWTTDQHLGKEFYGDYGVFEVSLNFPNQYVVEATGALQNEKEMYPGNLRQRLDISNFKTTRSEYTNPIPPDGTTKTWKFKAINVHDFAFTADPTYRIGEVVWNGVRCIALAQEEHAHRWQPSAQFVADVVRTYSQDVGMFGYPKMIAADARDGMEYPMLTLDGGSWPGHRGLIAHEVGHNWFFGMIGNNETYRASLDEGFTQFLTSMAMRKLTGVKGRPNAIDDQKVYHGYMNHAMGANTARLNTHSDHFHSAQRHGGGYGQVYYKTATMLYNLQYVLGDSLFSEAFKNYFNQWKFCHPYWADFRASIIDYTKVDLNWFFDEWVEKNSTIDYKLAGVKSLGDGQYELKIKRLGFPMPLDIEITDNAGGTHSYYIPNTYFQKPTSAIVLPTWVGWGLVKKEYRATITIPDGIKNVEIDPSGRLADVNRLNNSKKLPVRWKYDNLKKQPTSFRKYNLSYRPDIWYNSIDGVKVGARVKGNFYQSKHVFNLGVWANTEIGADPPYNTSEADPFSYQLDYHTGLKNQNRIVIQSRYIDGWVFDKIGWNRPAGKGQLGLSASARVRKNGDYLIYKDFVNVIDALETRISIGYNRPYRQTNSSGVLKLATYTTAIFSDYNYGSISAELTNNKGIGKFNLRTRIYARWMEGLEISPESMLLLQGANNSEMMENRYTRSIGSFTQDALSFSRSGNNRQIGGGLNLRGFSGYAVTNHTETDTFLIFGGSRGAAINAELDFGRLFNIKARKLRRYMNLQPYLFADAGILGNQMDQWSGLRIDAGLGAILSLRLPKLSGTRPLNIRFDMPFFINRIPEEETEYVAFRYVIGLNRTF